MDKDFKINMESNFDDEHYITLPVKFPKNCFGNGPCGNFLERNRKYGCCRAILSAKTVDEMIKTLETAIESFKELKEEN